MQISQLSQPNIIIPIPAQNYIIDNKQNPSIILCIATASKRVTFSGLSFAGSLFFNSDHSENLTSRLPTDLATTKNSAILLTCLVALKLLQRLGIKRILILTRSKLLTNILNRRNFNITHDISDISQKLEGIQHVCKQKKEKTTNRSPFLYQHATHKTYLSLTTKKSNLKKSATRETSNLCINLHN